MALISWVPKTYRKLCGKQNLIRKDLALVFQTVTYILRKNCRQSLIRLSVNASGSIVFIGLSDNILEKKKKRKNTLHNMSHTGHFREIEIAWLI